MEAAGGDTTQLKKALEWELSLDVRDLRSHAWYHGAISRMRAEEIVERDGEFLVRDCTSQPGNYVLTCHHKTHLHFVINKVVLQPDTVYERVQYQFEDDAYDTVPDLITYYVGSDKCITSASGARIHAPQNRLYPLSFYVSKHGLQSQDGGGPLSPLLSPLTTSTSTLRFSPYNSYRSPGQSPPRTRRDTPPRLPFKKQRSHSITPAEMCARAGPLAARTASCDRGNSADGVIQAMTRSYGHDTHSLPRHHRAEDGLLLKTIPGEHSLSPCLERKRSGEEDKDDVSDTPPPKPSRVPSLHLEHKDANMGTSKYSKGDVFFNGAAPAHHFEPLQILPQGQCKFQRDSDSGNGSGDSVLSIVTGDSSDQAAPPYGGVVIKNPRHSQVFQQSVMRVVEYDTAAEEALLFNFPTLQPSSAFDIDNFHTLLLPTSENKPLDETALQGVKMMLHETGSRIIANHLTRIDLELTTATGLKCLEGDVGLGVSCGMELCTLPHGHQLRKDLIERTECLKLFVAVTIVTCPTAEERADTLNKWIQVAMDTKAALGNLFGFCGIMMGLCMPQVQRLSATWHVLRQRFTDSAFNYEAKLRPTMKSMNECTNPQAPNTTIPHLLPLILLQELTFDHLIGSKSSSLSGVVGSCLGAWETSSDFGLGALYSHMEAARSHGPALPTMRRNAEIMLGGDVKGDYLLTDAFRTEFQLKFLWGSRGANVAIDERHSKFEQVLNAMSEKCEPSLSAAS